MACTFYEGKLSATKRWEEAPQEFNVPLARLGGKSGFDLLKEMLILVAEGKAMVTHSKDFTEYQISKGKTNLKTFNFPADSDTIWIHGDGYWIRITKSGELEIGEPAA